MNILKLNIVKYYKFKINYCEQISLIGFLKKLLKIVGHFIDLKYTFNGSHICKILSNPDTLLGNVRIENDHIFLV